MLLLIQRGCQVRTTNCQMLLYRHIGSKGSWCQWQQFMQRRQSSTGGDRLPGLLSRLNHLRLPLMIGVGIALLKSSPDTYLRAALRQHIYQHYTDGCDTKVTPRVESLMRHVMSDIRLDEQHISLTSLFICIMSKPITFGCFSSVWGYLIGLPDFYQHHQPSQVDLDRMHYFTRSDDPGKMDPIVRQGVSERDLQALRQTLCLSDSALKFALARELYRGQHCYYKLEMFLALFYFGCCYLITRRSPKPKWLVNGMVAAVAVLFYVASVDELRKSVEGQLDRQASELGSEYARGGVELYQKIIQRHIMLRKLMPNQEGTKLFNLLGEHTSGMIRSRHRPYALRKQDCERILAQSSQ